MYKRLSIILLFLFGATTYMMVSAVELTSKGRLLNTMVMFDKLDEVIDFQEDEDVLVTSLGLFDYLERELGTETTDKIRFIMQGSTVEVEGEEDDEEENEEDLTSYDFIEKHFEIMERYENFMASSRAFYMEENPDATSMDPLNMIFYEDLKESIKENMAVVQVLYNLFEKGLNPYDVDFLNHESFLKFLDKIDSELKGDGHDEL